MIETIAANLRRIDSLNKLSSAEYINTSVGPYHSSIGSHVRHVLDIFNCLVDGFDQGRVDLTKRVRGSSCETDISEALDNLENMIACIESLTVYDRKTPIELVDDLGDGKVSTPSTLGSILYQAHSHAIHHFAIIGYLLHNQNIKLPDSAFGYNPTTPITSLT